MVSSTAWALPSCRPRSGGRRRSAGPWRRQRPPSAAPRRWCAALRGRQEGGKHVKDGRQCTVTEEALRIVGRIVAAVQLAGYGSSGQVASWWLLDRQYSRRCTMYTRGACGERYPHPSHAISTSPERSLPLLYTDKPSLTNRQMGECHTRSPGDSVSPSSTKSASCPCSTAGSGASCPAPAPLIRTPADCLSRSPCWPCCSRSRSCCPFSASRCCLSRSTSSPVLSSLGPSALPHGCRSPQARAVPAGAPGSSTTGCSSMLVSGW